MNRFIIVLCVLLMTTLNNRLLAQTEDAPQDIVITNFELVPTGVILDNVNDNNGDACALIKFSVRDTSFVIEPNLGFVRRESKTSEIRLWVPAGTKRLTISHRGMYPLRNWQIPEKIESKRVYHAYLWATITNESEPETKHQTKPEATVIEKPNGSDEEDEDTSDTGRIRRRKFSNANTKTEIERDNTTKKKDKVSVKPERRNHFYFGIGHSIPIKNNDGMFPSNKAIRGVSCMAGVDLNHHQIELGGLFPSESSDDMYFYNGNTTLLADMSYKLNRGYLRYGYELRTKEAVGAAMTPMIGLGLNYIKGDGKDYSSAKHYSHGSALSINLALRLSLYFGPIGIHVTPEYNINAYQSDLYKLVQESYGIFKNWVKDRGGVTFGVYVYI